MSYTNFRFTEDKIQNKEKGCLVNINKDEVLMFTGYVKICVKKGIIEINGYRMIAPDANETDVTYYDLYSAQYWKHGCLSITAIEDSQFHLLPFDFESKYEVRETSKTCDSVFQIVGCHFVMNGDYTKKPLRSPLSWRKCSDYFTDTSNTSTPSIMVCGRVQSGKSTFSRYLANRLLNKYSSVAYLDCDVGQSEFNPEGILSITMIQSPLFGAPHTHQHDMKQQNNKYYRWKSYYYGSNNPSANSSLYLQCISQLYSDWTQFIGSNDIPLIVNTHGWVTGLGATLLKSLLVKLNPMHLIEIHNDKQALFGGVEMDYLVEVKDMFIHQNKSHNWCDADYNYEAKQNKSSMNDNSLVTGWWKQLTTTDEFEVKEYQSLKPSQKKWVKYLNDLVQLKFECDDNQTNDDGKWYNNINITKTGKRTKGQHEIQLFKSFIGTHIHYVERVAFNTHNALDTEMEKVQKIIARRKERKRLSTQKRLLSMAAYFTQQVLVDNVSQYLREDAHCYKVPFDDISILFLEENMNVNDEKHHNLVLHALNGVMVGLCIMDSVCMKKDDIMDEPPMKKRKINGMNEDKDWKLNVMDTNKCNGRAIECVGIGIIRSINVKKQAFYLITPVHPSDLNKVNVFIRGKTNIPSIFLYDKSMLAPPLYINSIPMNERIFTSTC